MPRKKRAAPVRTAPTSPQGQDGPAPAFPVVGIGGSAGAFEAIETLLKELPERPGMALVIVQHISPTHPSALAEVLGRASKLPVEQVEDEAPVEKDRVYVIPPNRHMLIEDGRLRLVERPPRVPHRPIDVFFRSLAQHQGHATIGVLLSGADSDGTLGLEEIKAAGGITFAQDETAQHGSMPRSAVAAGCVDFVLPPARIADELARIARHDYVAPNRPAPPDPSAEPSLAKVIQILHEATGVDFRDYKVNTLYRRISRRMVLHRLASLPEYVRFLRKHPAEVEALYQDVLISVTSFFRNAESYDALKSVVLPRIVKDRSRHEPIRIWVLGCSTGEEAYSIAMTFAEFAEDNGVAVPAQIFATDLNAACVEQARAGVYPRDIAHDVSPERLRRFFAEVDGRYRIAKTIRDMCVFARHNVLSDPPFSHLDLVSCRNLLIYLEPNLQQRAIAVLHYALKPNGCLWLGSSETIGAFRDEFEVLDAKHKIYVKTAGSMRLPLPLGGRPLAQSAQTAAPGRTREGGPSASGTDTHREAERILLARYVPPGVLVSTSLEVLQFRGDTSPYLAPAPGKASLNVLKMAREGLLVGLRAALHRARKEEATTRETGLRVKSNGGWREVDVEVVPVRGASTRETCYLVLFSDATQRVAAPAPAHDAPPPARSDASDAQIARLTQELAATREYLQSVIEQQEAANEELQSANEEVQSSNEELQSINEELETSKEEIQSSNEELATVNDELHNRNLELSQTNNDLINLISSVQVAIVMLGPDLRIRRFTPAAEKLLNLIPADVGRPITDIKLSVDVEDLDRVLAGVIDTVTVKELEVRDRAGRWYSLRIRPYRTLENKIDGAVLAFIDIDAFKRAQIELTESEERMRLLIEGAAGFALILLDGDGSVMSWNTGAQRIFGWTDAEILAHHASRLFPPEEKPRCERELREAEAGHASDDENWLVRKDGSRFWASGTTTALRDEEGRLRGFAKVVRDASEKRRLEDELRARVAELAAADRRKDEFIALLSHELRNPLAPLRSAVEALNDPRVDGPDRETARAMIQRQVANMARLVDDLLDVSRIARGTIQVRKRRVTLQDVVARAVADAHPYVEARSQPLEVVVPDEPVWIEADPVRLGQVLVNLLHNASKFSERGKPIELRAEVRPAASGASPAPGKEAIVSVIDHGAGIAPEVLPRIFDLFAQGEHGPTRVHGGLGIGLTLVKRLVDLHGGSVEASSRGLGHGSRFTIRLAVAAEGAEREEARAPESPPPAAGGPYRVLVVDDNADAARSLALLIRLRGHDVRVADSGPAAIAEAEAFRPHAIVLDIAMPMMDGYSVARELRQRPEFQSTCLIALSGYGRDEDRGSAAEAGFDAHLTKPADHEAILRIVARGRTT